MDQIELIKEKISKLQCDREVLQSEQTELEFDLKDIEEEKKRVDAELLVPYSFGTNLFRCIFSFAITGGVDFLLFKWWKGTEFSAFVGGCFFVVTILSLILNIFIVSSSTKKHHNKELEKLQQKKDTLLQQKEKIIAEKFELFKEITEIQKNIDNLKLLQKEEEKEKKKRLEEEERQRKAELEIRFQEIINSEKIDRKDLTAIADAGHVNAKIELAKLLIDDYFSKMLTKEEKEQLASTVYKYLKGINTENDVEVELLELFSYTMSSCLEGGIFMKSNLKKIRAIKDNNTLSEKYDSLANKMIQHIVSVIDGHDRSGGSSINYSYLTKNDDVSSSLCAYYQNGCCKHGYNANYNNISCGYSECFHSVCPNYQKR